MVGTCLGLQLSGGKFPVTGILQHGIIFQFELTIRCTDRIAEHSIAGKRQHLARQQQRKGQYKKSTAVLDHVINPSKWPEWRG